MNQMLINANLEAFSYVIYALFTVTHNSSQFNIFQLIVLIKLRSMYT